MQNQTQNPQQPQARLMCLGTKEQITSLHPNIDLIVMDRNVPKLSVEYARARNAINADYKIIFARNQALAKTTRKQSKTVAVEFLGGKVSKKDETDAQGAILIDERTGKQKFRLIVSFPDGSVANL